MTIDNPTFDKIVKNYKRYVEPFLAIFIFIGLIFALIGLWHDYNDRKLIAENCGWQDEDVKCWCRKSDYLAMSQNEFNINVTSEGDGYNVSLDR